MGKTKYQGSTYYLGEHASSPLQWAVQWFKTMSTNEYIHGMKKNGRLSTKNCGNAIIDEHIIRDEQSHLTIAKYIANNPVYWVKDELYGERT